MQGAATGKAERGTLRDTGTPRYLRRSATFRIPGEWGEIRLVAAMLDHPAALARFNERDLLPSDFESEFASMLVLSLLDGGDVPEIIKQQFNQHTATGDFSWRACVATSCCIGDEHGTTTVVGAFAAVDAFAARVYGGLLVKSLRQAAWRVRCDEYAPKDRHELDRLFDAAGIDGWEAA